jgi:hypothetical protein
MARLQKPFPQPMQIGWQFQLAQGAFDLGQIQIAEIVRASMHQNLAEIPPALERIG